MTVDAESQWQAKKIFEALLPGSQVIDVSEVREPAPRSPWLDGYSTPNPQPQLQAKKSSGILPFIAGAALGYVAGRATEPDAVFIAADDEGTGSQSWWAQRAQASLASPTREAELSFFEETVTSACRERGVSRFELDAESELAIHKAKDSINQKWDRREEEAREPHGPRLPMTETDWNTVNGVIAMAKQLPFTIHLLWYPRTQILGCIFDDLSLMLKSLDPNPHYNRIVEMLEGKDVGVRAIRWIPYASDGPSNAPFEIAEEWLQENGYWFFRGPF